MNRTGPPDPLPVHQVLLSLLATEAPVASWYERVLPCSGTLPQLTSQWRHRRAVVVVVAAFRSLGQVSFINHLLSGLLLLALLLQSPSVALFATFGILAAHLAAKALGSSWEDRHNGIYGFNGALVGSAMVTFADLGPPGAAFLWTLAALGGGALTSVLVHGPGRRLDAVTGLPPMTLPFFLVTWGLLALAAVADVPPLQLHSPATVPPAGSALQAFLLALPRGFGQVFFCGDLASGGLVLAATAVASPVAAGVGLMGAAVGALELQRCSQRPCHRWHLPCPHPAQPGGGGLGGPHRQPAQRAAGAADAARLAGAHASLHRRHPGHPAGGAPGAAHRCSCGAPRDPHAGGASAALPGDPAAAERFPLPSARGRGRSRLDQPGPVGGSGAAGAIRGAVRAPRL